MALGAGKVWWSARFVNALVDGQVGPSWMDRMDEFLAPYEGVQLDEDDLRSLETRAAAHFIDILASDGVAIRGWRLVLHNDEVLGPRCFVRSSAGAELSLAEFMLGRRQGTIDSEAG